MTVLRSLISTAILPGPALPTLARQFGREYAAYRSRVHRWVPRIP